MSADFRKIERILADAFRAAPGFEIKEAGDVFAQRRSLCQMAQIGEAACVPLIHPVNLTAIAKAIAEEV